MRVSASIVGQDHLDLLISAAMAYGLLADPARASSMSHVEPLIAAAAATTVGRQLQRVNRDSLAAARDGIDEPEPYSFTPVDEKDIVPMHVLKAVQAMEHLCYGAPGWEDAPVRRLLEAVTRAAIQRLPGYGQAPWVWTRGELRRGPAIGVCGRWRPEGADVVEWVSPDVARQQWATAAFVVLTTDQLHAMDGMPDRPAIYVATGRELGDEVWQILDGLSFEPEHILFFPAALPWLRDQVRSADG